MKRGKILGLFVILLFFNSIIVSADNETFSLDKGFNWLNDEMTSTNWGGTVDTISWSILALNNRGYDVSGGISRLRQVEDDYNWDNDIQMNKKQYKNSQ